MKQTFIFLLLATSVLAGPYPGGGPYPYQPAGMPSLYLTVPSLTGPNLTSPYNYSYNNSGGQTIATNNVQGVLQYLWVVPDQLAQHGITTNLDRINLRVWADTTTNNLGTGFPATNKIIDIPIGMLIGDMDRKLITNQNYCVVNRTAYVDYQDISTNALEGGPIITIGLRLPCMFNNGIYAELWNTYSNNAWPFGYIFGYWNTNSAQTGPYASYRPQTAYWSNQWQSNQNSGNLILSMPQTNGLIIGQMESICNLTNAADVGQAFELNGPKYVTSLGVTNFGPGADDSYLSTFTATGGENRHYNVGTTHYLQLNTLVQYAIESYRWFVEDAMAWNNGMSLYMGKGPGGLLNVDRADIAVLCYAPIRNVLFQPSLIRTGTNTATSGTVTIGAFNCIGGNYLQVNIGLKTAVTRTISSVTVNGVAMTNLFTTNYVSALAGKIAVYGLANPPSGDIVVTLSGAYTVCNVNSLLFNNVGNATVQSAIQGAGGVTTIGGAVNTLATDLVSDVVEYNSVSETASVAGTMQQIWATEKPGNPGDIACSTILGTAPSTTSTWNFTASDNFSWIAVVLNGN